MLLLRGSGWWWLFTGLPDFVLVDIHRSEERPPLPPPPVKSVTVRLDLQFLPGQLRHSSVFFAAAAAHKENLFKHITVLSRRTRHRVN